MPKFRAIPVASLDRFQGTQASGAGSSGAKKREVSADSIVYEFDDAAAFLRDEPGAMLAIVPGARPADDAPEQFVQKRYVAVPRIVRPSP